MYSEGDEGGVTIKDSTFSDNTAENNGGAVSSDTSISVTNSDITDNQATTGVCRVWER